MTEEDRSGQTTLRITTPHLLSSPLPRESAATESAACLAPLSIAYSNSELESTVRKVSAAGSNSGPSAQVASDITCPFLSERIGCWLVKLFSQLRVKGRVVARMLRGVALASTGQADFFMAKK